MRIIIFIQHPPPNPHPKNDDERRVLFQISTYIEYKGSVYDNIDELSGGERQRCELAYLLALNDLFGSKIILLDECLNNLDSTINTDVLTFLRENCTNKSIIVISHEAVKGVFDEEIFI